MYFRSIILDKKPTMSINNLDVLTFSDFVAFFPKIIEAAYPFSKIKFNTMFFINCTNPGIWQHCLNALAISK